MKLSTIVREAFAWRLVLLAFRLHPPLVGDIADGANRRPEQGAASYARAAAGAGGVWGLGGVGRERP